MITRFSPVGYNATNAALVDPHFSGSEEKPAILPTDTYLGEVYFQQIVNKGLIVPKSFNADEPTIVVFDASNHTQLDALLNELGRAQKNGPGYLWDRAYTQLKQPLFDPATEAVVFVAWPKGQSDFARFNKIDFNPAEQKMTIHLIKIPEEGRTAVGIPGQPWYMAVFPKETVQNAPDIVFEDFDGDDDEIERLLASPV